MPSSLLEGTLIDLVTAGRVEERERRRRNISHADLDEAMRGSSVEQVAKVARLTLEPSGKITIKKEVR